MSFERVRCGIAAISLAVLAIVPAQADTFPSRPIRLIVPTQAGAAQDVIARLLQPYLEKSLGQPVVVENRSGASTMIGTDAVAKAAPDGYTWLIVPTTFTVNAALNAKLSFDPERDFEPVTVLVKNPLLFAVNAKVPATTLKELVATGEAGPGQVQLRLVRRVDPGAPAAGNVDRAGRHQNAAHSLPRWRAGGARGRHRRGATGAALPARHLAAASGRNRAGAGDRRHQPRCKAPRSADRGGSRVSGIVGLRSSIAGSPDSRKATARTVAPPMAHPN